MSVNPRVIYGACTAGGFVLGGGTAFLFTKNHFKKKYQALADEEIESVKTSYKLLRKEGEYADPATAVVAYQARLEDLEYAANDSVEAAQAAADEAVEEAIENLEESLSTQEEVNAAVVVEETRPKPAVRSIFDDIERRRIEAEAVRSAEDPEGEAFDELKARDPLQPYQIDREQFQDDSNDFSKITITYWEGDDTLCDEREVIIPNLDELISREVLQHFGEDEENPEVVYARNEKLETDFEIVREERDFSEVVLGVRNFKDKTPKVRKMRGTDE